MATFDNCFLFTFSPVSFQGDIFIDNAINSTRVTHIHTGTDTRVYKRYIRNLSLANMLCVFMFVYVFECMNGW